jgi:hypothetical protein
MDEALVHLDTSNMTNIVGTQAKISKNNGNSFDCKINLDVSLKTYKLELETVELPPVVYNIQPPNNIIKFIGNSYSLPPGQYTRDGLIRAINSIGVIYVSLSARNTLNIKLNPPGFLYDLPSSGESYSSTNSCISIAVSGDGTTILEASRYVHVYNGLNFSQLTANYDNGNDAVLISCSISHDGDTLAVGYQGGDVIVYKHIRSDPPTTTLLPGSVTYFGLPVTALSEDGSKIIISDSPNGVLNCYNTSDFSLKRNDDITHYYLKVSNDFTRIAYFTIDSTGAINLHVNSYNVDFGPGPNPTQIDILVYPQNNIYLCFSGDGKTLCVALSPGGADILLKVYRYSNSSWDSGITLNTDRFLTPGWTGLPGQLVDISYNGNVIVIGYYYQSVIGFIVYTCTNGVWDNGILVARPTHYGLSTVSVCISPDGTTVFTALTNLANSAGYTGYIVSVFNNVNGLYPKINDRIPGKDLDTGTSIPNKFNYFQCSTDKYYQNIIRILEQDTQNQLYLISNAPDSITGSIDINTRQLSVTTLSNPGLHTLIICAQNSAGFSRALTLNFNIQGPV